MLIKGICETIKNETKKQKERFLGMLLSTLDASLLGNLLTGKDTIKAEEGTIRAGEDTVRASQNFWCHLIFELILKHKSIFRTSLNFMVFIQEIIYIK